MRKLMFSTGLHSCTINPLPRFCRKFRNSFRTFSSAIELLPKRFEGRLPIEMMIYDTGMQQDNSLRRRERAMQMRTTDWSEVIADASCRLLYTHCLWRERISNVTRELTISLFTWWLYYVQRPMLQSKNSNNHREIMWDLIKKLNRCSRWQDAFA